MGLFDSVYEPCVKCGEPVEYQSKAADAPYMNRYTVGNAPLEILLDVINSPTYCGKCGTWNALIDPCYPPHGEKPKPQPKAMRVRTPGEHEHFGHDIHKDMKWWDTGFTFADIIGWADLRSIK